ncbi:uncharacterized protein A4U43_C01F8840 [Asparagus officinalis]|uniref:Uncharacterized protein n=1 Tax=Asparagus officinalis TaxID=4686 RepID=A0A5P1FSM3_ASPOF|nr:uncharacterized protein A4U43_C01F8840 [Asparagus officinalis]
MPILTCCEENIDINRYGSLTIDQVTKGDKQLSESPFGRFQGSPHADKLIKVDIPDIVSVSACADLTLPPGAGLCIDTIHGPEYLPMSYSECERGGTFHDPSPIPCHLTANSLPSD